ncbi:aminotransferase class I/II-fold pyridoxal phosphate-dependent enzyme [Alkalihalobacillus sp. FSL W8-0930]
MSLEMIPGFRQFQQLDTSLDKLPFFRVNEGVATNKIKVNGISKINYSTYNYLGLNGTNEINEAVIQAIQQYGTSVSSSRLLSGEIPLHRSLERNIADFLGVEDSIVQVGGHSTNVNTIAQLVDSSDLVICDALVHNSIMQGVQLSGSKMIRFKHNDMLHLDKLLKRFRHKYRNVLLIVEGVYSMDGDLCKLPELISLKHQYDCLLMVDEAHSIGTIGRGGRGITSYYGIDPTNVDVLMGSMSKSLNSCGGYIAGNKSLITFLRYNLPGFVFSVGMTPANAAAAQASLDEIQRKPELVEKLLQNADYFLGKLVDLGVDTGLSKNSPVVPLIVGDSEKALWFAEKLYEQGVNAMPIIYPAVKETESRIRFFMSAIHTKEDLDYTVEVIKNIVDEEKGL